MDQTEQSTNRHAECTRTPSCIQYSCAGALSIAWLWIFMGKHSLIALRFNFTYHEHKFSFEKITFQSVKKMEIHFKEKTISCSFSFQFLLSGLKCT